MEGTGNIRLPAFSPSQETTQQSASVPGRVPDTQVPGLTQPRRKSVQMVQISERRERAAVGFRNRGRGVLRPEVRCKANGFALLRPVLFFPLLCFFVFCSVWLLASLFEVLFICAGPHVFGRPYQDL